MVKPTKLQVTQHEMMKNKNKLHPSNHIDITEPMRMNAVEKAFEDPIKEQRDEAYKKEEKKKNEYVYEPNNDSDAKLKLLLKGGSTVTRQFDEPRQIKDFYFAFNVNPSLFKKHLQAYKLIPKKIKKNNIKQGNTCFLEQQIIIFDICHHYYHWVTLSPLRKVSYSLLKLGKQAYSTIVKQEPSGNAVSPKLIKDFEAELEKYSWSYREVSILTEIKKIVDMANQIIISSTSTRHSFVTSCSQQTVDYIKEILKEKIAIDKTEVEMLIDPKKDVSIYLNNNIEKKSKYMMSEVRKLIQSLFSNSIKRHKDNIIKLLDSIVSSVNTINQIQAFTEEENQSRIRLNKKYVAGYDSICQEKQNISRETFKKREEAGRIEVERNESFEYEMFKCQELEVMERNKLFFIEHSTRTDQVANFNEHNKVLLMSEIHIGNLAKANQRVELLEAELQRLAAEVAEKERLEREEAARKAANSVPIPINKRLLG